jgi:hypothetical protein
MVRHKEIQAVCGPWSKEKFGNLCPKALTIIFFPKNYFSHYLRSQSTCACCNSGRHGDDGVIDYDVNKSDDGSEEVDYVDDDDHCNEKYDHASW